MSYSHQDQEIPSHREHFTTSPLFVAKLPYFFLSSCFFLGIWTYSITSYFERIGSLTKMVSSCTKLVKSDKHGSLTKFHLSSCTFLFHLSLKLPGNFKKKNVNCFWGFKSIPSSVFRKIFHTLTQNCRTFWNQKHHQILQKVKLSFFFYMMQANNAVCNFQSMKSLV